VIERWTATRASDDEFRLAEGPVWDGPRERLLWVEIEAGAVNTGRLSGGRIERTGTQVLDRTVGAVAVTRTGGLLVAGSETLHEVAADGQVTPGPRILPTGSGRRLNDGKCDPSGAFIVGTMQLSEKPGTDEVLVRVDPDRSVTVIDSGLAQSNGLAWTPEFYSIDTAPGVIYVRHDYQSPREVFLRDDWDPDGMCADRDGNLWVAVYGSGEVRRFSPRGELTGVVEVGEPEVTCPEFAGPGLDTLVITTRHHLYTADVGAVGVPSFTWAD
jgi:sugar lactone lactonase YvrE